jgi:hypothetical protein
MKNYVVPFWISFSIFILTFFLTSSFDKKDSVKISKPIEIQQKDSPIVLKSPPCVELYHSIEKYSLEYNIPSNIAFGVAFSETRYQGPFHWKYAHDKTSGAGALGPMQVMYSTAKGLFPRMNFTKEKLMKDIDFNVHCSMKLLRKLYNKYGDWKRCLGAYNTGKPCVNGYAIKVYNYQMKI